MFIFHSIFSKIKWFTFFLHKQSKYIVFKFFKILNIHRFIFNYFWATENINITLCAGNELKIKLTFLTNFVV